MSTRSNLLVVCGRNKRRSRTAEYLFKNDRRLAIRSVGLSPKSERRINVRDVEWADQILVMEDGQAARIAKDFRELDLPPIQVLHIPDEYAYLDPELVDILEDAINATLRTDWGIA